MFAYLLNGGGAIVAGIMIMFALAAGIIFGLLGLVVILGLRRLSANKDKKDDRQPAGYQAASIVGVILGVIAVILLQWFILPLLLEVAGRADMSNETGILFTICSIALLIVLGGMAGRRVMLWLVGFGSQAELTKSGAEQPDEYSEIAIQECPHCNSEIEASTVDRIDGLALCPNCQLFLEPT